MTLFENHVQLVHTHPSWGFRIVGVPLPTPRKMTVMPTHLAHKKGRYIGERVWQPAAYLGTPMKKWMRQVKAQVQSEYDGPVWDGPLAMSLTFFIPRPRGHYTRSGESFKPSAPHYCTSVRAGDWDNLGKGICDSLEGVLYHNDSRIVDGHVWKRYVGVRDEPGVHIKFQPLDDAFHYKPSPARVRANASPF